MMIMVLSLLHSTHAVVIAVHESHAKVGQDRGMMRARKHVRNEKCLFSVKAMWKREVNWYVLSTPVSRGSDNFNTSLPSLNLYWFCYPGSHADAETYARLGIKLPFGSEYFLFVCMLVSVCLIVCLY